MILGLALSRDNKEIALMLSLAAVAMTLIAAVQYLEPVFDFFQKLESISGLDSQMLKILFKTAGIGLLAEVTSLICQDSGNQTYSKGIQIAAAGVILWLSIPLLKQLLTLLENILGTA